MRCAASFLLAQSTPTTSSAATATSSAPSLRGDSLQPRYAEERQRQHHQQQQQPCAIFHDARDLDGGSVHEAAGDRVLRRRSRGLAGSSRAPRPVTARQLARALVGLGATGRAAPAEHSPCFPDCESTSSASGVDRRLPDAVRAARLGPSTIALDGAPCHRVVLCGRVVCCVDASSSGTFAMPHDLVCISDGTGLVWVLRPRPALSWCGMSTDSTHAAQWPVTVTQRALACSRDGGGTGSHARVAPRSHGCLLDVDCAITDDAAAAAFSTGFSESTSAAAHAEASEGAVEKHESGADDPLAMDADEAPCSVNDYVVCVGSLVFADVDPTVHSALERYGEAIQHATWAAAVRCPVGSSTPSPQKVARQETRSVLSEHKVSTACLETNSSSCFVLLPGSEAPLTLEAAREELGVVGALPPSTRYLSAAEAAQWASSNSISNILATPQLREPASAAAAAAAVPETSSAMHPADPFTPRAPTSATPLHRNRVDAAGAPAQWDAVPVFAVRGDVRVVLDTNECAFWWLSAMETHMRLAARARTYVGLRDDGGEH